MTPIRPSGGDRRPPRPPRHVLGALAAVLLFWGCSDHEFHPPDVQERMDAAAARFSEQMFDTVTWESEENRLYAGNLVYATTCRRCHGALGKGETDYSLSRNLAVPSLVEADWKFAENPDSVRYRIFVGHEGGMPVFQLSGLSPAEIDAVTAYILLQLRPDVLDPEGGAETGALPSP